MLAVWAAPLEDVRAIRAIGVAAVQALKLVSTLAMIVSSDALMTAASLLVSVHVSDGSSGCITTSEGHGRIPYDG